MRINLYDSMTLLQNLDVDPIPNSQVCKFAAQRNPETRTFPGSFSVLDQTVRGIFCAASSLWIRSVRMRRSSRRDGDGLRSASILRRVLRRFRRTSLCGRLVMRGAGILDETPVLKLRQFGS